MASIAETLMQEVLSRLQGSPPLIDNNNVRRQHRTIVDREHAPAVHLIDGTDTPTAARNDCQTDHKFAFTISIYVRADDGYVLADPLKIEVNRRLESTAADPYPVGITIKQGRITPEQDVADADVLRIDMEYEFTYHTAGWTLE